MKKIGIIIVYFGKLPEYFHYFILGCLFNRQIEWILFTDQDKPTQSPENIIYFYFDIVKFNKLASDKLQFPIQITNAYKLCDFKPAFGLIFEDFLKDYDYWGYCDLDLVLGNLGEFLKDDIIKDHDIISTYEKFLSGPFCLYKNNEITKNLFMTCPDYQSILQNNSHLAFDENIPGKNLKKFSLRKLIYFTIFIFKELFSMKKYNYSLAELRFNFQWYYKQKNMLNKYPADMTEAVWQAKTNNTLHACFRHLLYSDRYYIRNGYKTWQIRWKSGILTDMVSGRNIFAFHYPESKKNMNFKIETWDPVSEHFSISASGIKNG